MQVNETVQLRQRDLVPLYHVPPTIPAGVRDHWIYATVTAADPSGVTLVIDHPGNRLHRARVFVAAGDLSARVREKADVLALAALATDPKKKIAYQRQAARLGPAAAPAGAAPQAPAKSGGAAS